MLSDEKRKTAVLLTATELKSQGSRSTHDEGDEGKLLKKKKERDRYRLSARDIKAAKHFKGGNKTPFRVCV